MIFSDVANYHLAARRFLPKFAFGYHEGRAASELTLHRNRAALRALASSRTCCATRPRSTRARRSRAAQRHGSPWSDPAASAAYFAATRKKRARRARRGASAWRIAPRRRAPSDSARYGGPASRSIPKRERCAPRVRTRCWWHRAPGSRGTAARRCALPAGSARANRERSAAQGGSIRRWEHSALQRYREGRGVGRAWRAARPRTPLWTRGGGAFWRHRRARYAAQGMQTCMRSLGGAEPTDLTPALLAVHGMAVQEAATTI